MTERTPADTQQANTQQFINGSRVLVFIEHSRNKVRVWQACGVWWQLYCSKCVSVGGVEDCIYVIQKIEEVISVEDMTTIDSRMALPNTATGHHVSGYVGAFARCIRHPNWLITNQRTHTASASSDDHHSASTSSDDHNYCVSAWSPYYKKD